MGLYVERSDKPNWGILDSLWELTSQDGKVSMWEAPHRTPRIGEPSLIVAPTTEQPSPGTPTFKKGSPGAPTVEKPFPEAPTLGEASPGAPTTEEPSPGAPSFYNLVLHPLQNYSYWSVNQNL